MNQPRPLQGLIANEPLKNYTTLRVGGPATWLYEVSERDQLQQLLTWAQSEALPWIVIGRGSNLLVCDEGFEGLVIAMRLEGESWSIDGDRALVTVGSGMSLASLAARTAKAGWSGLEFACGIPASVGGAVAMNAGAHGQMIQESLVEVVIWSQGSFISLPASELEFAYRHSRFHDNPEIIVEATFALKHDEKALERVREMTSYRLRTQPWKAATAGCFFRNPADMLPDMLSGCSGKGSSAKSAESRSLEVKPLLSAGALIERAALKGKGSGGAQVSELHGNFLVNQTGEAKAADFIALCKEIRAEVKKSAGIDLVGEVRYLESGSTKMRSI